MNREICIEKVQGVLKTNDALLKIEYYIYKNGEILCVPYENFLSKNSSAENEDAQFLAKWTLLEAALKASGEGFGAIASAKKIFEESSSLTTAFVRNERTYLLSIVIKRKTEQDL